MLPILFDGTTLTKICDSRRGIYCWVNRINDKRYVGMAAGVGGFASRIRNELSSAATERSSGTKLLTSAIRKYNISSFLVYELVDLSEFVDEIFDKLERQFIRKFDCMSPQGYNLTEGGKGTLGFSSLDGADSRRGRSSIGVSEKNSKRYELVSPSGNTHYITNLSAFAVANGFRKDAFYSVANGNSKSYCGWHLGTMSKTDYAKSISKEAFFITPNNEIIKVFNMNKFADAHGLSQGALNGVWLRRKSYNSTKGYKRATDEQIMNFDENTNKTWNFDKWVS